MNVTDPFTDAQVEIISRAVCIGKGLDPEELSYLPPYPGELVKLGGYRPKYPRWQLEASKVKEQIECMRIEACINAYLMVENQKAKDEHPSE